MPADKDPAAVWPLSVAPVEDDFVEDEEEDEEEDEDDCFDFEDFDEQEPAPQDPSRPPAKWRFPS
jgi:hypothetical protein